MILIVKIYFEKNMAMIALQIAKTIQKAMVNNGTKVVELLELTLFNIWFKFEQVTIIVIMRGVVVN